MKKLVEQGIELVLGALGAYLDRKRVREQRRYEQVVLEERRRMEEILRRSRDQS